MDCPPDSPCPLEGRVVRLEALARATERWATGTAEPTMLRDAGRLVALEARVALCETHQDLEQDWGARLAALTQRQQDMDDGHADAMLELAGHIGSLQAALERPAPAQGQPRGCDTCLWDNEHHIVGKHCRGCYEADPHPRWQPREGGGQ